MVWRWRENERNRFAEDREALLREIDLEVRETATLTGRSALSPAVRRALAEVPREEFVSPEDRPFAYINRPLPIGHGQTISQPFVVALMTDLLDPEAGDRVLEIGTGSGYQAAVLARIVGRVYTVEVVEALAEQARRRFQRLGYENIDARSGDGHRGWPEEAPFDGIIVTAAAATMPRRLLSQLGRGGRMVVPVGAAFARQDLLVVTKDDAGAITERPVIPVAFVPFIERDD